MFPNKENEDNLRCHGVMVDGRAVLWWSLEII